MASEDIFKESEELMVIDEEPLSKDHTEKVVESTTSTENQTEEVLEAPAEDDAEENLEPAEDDPPEEDLEPAEDDPAEEELELNDDGKLCFLHDAF